MERRLPQGRPRKDARNGLSAQSAKAPKPNGNGASLGFEAQLFLAADKLRKNLKPSDYKHVALGLIFLKHISNAFEARHKTLLDEDPAAAEDPDEYLAENVFWVPKEARWSHLQASAKQSTIGKLIDDAMTEIEKANPGLKGVLPKDYNRPALDKVMVGELIDLISGIAMGEPNDKAKDILGRVYEYFLGGFAGSEGKRGGEFYTPRSVVRVLVEMLTLQQSDAAKEATEEGKKRAHRRYSDAVLALSKAFALAGASDAAKTIRDEVGFFEAIRAALIKSVPGEGKKTAAERELAIQQIVSRAVVSTEIIDIMKAAGLETPDISILSDEFLAEVREMEKKNLAIEALKKLINGDVRSQAKRNLMQSRGFSERLEAAIARYHANAITTAQVLEELIQLAKDIRAARTRGEESGLSDEEIAFYDALAENDSAREAMGEPSLRVIAHELVQVIKSNASVDWMHRDSARANIRRHVKRLLRRYGYPPDLQDSAVQNVLRQAEALSAEWAA